MKKQRLSSSSAQTLSVIVHTFVRREPNQILLLKRQGTGFMDGYYSLPGGHVEAGETPSQAAVREVYEETELIVRKIEPSVVMPFPGGWDFLFESVEWDGTPTISEPEKCSALNWHDQFNLPQDVVPFLPRAIELIQSNSWYHEYFP